MNLISTRLPGVLVVETQVFRDPRGHVREAWHRRKYAELGLGAEFVQDNVSVSHPGVLRGLHYQHPHGQGKLISVLAGSIFDVAVDIRKGSPDFAKWVGVELSAENGRQLYIPTGFAHGFVVLGSDDAVVAYKCTAFYAPQDDGAVLWDDPEIAVEWPGGGFTLSAKDRGAPRLRDLPPGRLPAYDGP